MNTLQAQTAAEHELGQEYLSSLINVLDAAQLLQRHILQIIEQELSRKGFTDLSAQQALYLFITGCYRKKPDALPSYTFILYNSMEVNSQHLRENGYTVNRPHANDPQSDVVRLTSKGHEVVQFLLTLFEDNPETIGTDDLLKLIHSLSR